MRQINLETWPRREHFKVLNSFDYPHFNMCANVDITSFYPAIKQRGVSMTLALMYVVARTANERPEFRTRIRGDKVVEHEIVHPSTTYLAEGDLYSLLTVPYDADFSRFAARGAAQIADLQENVVFENDAGIDDLLYMTSIPWVSFTGFMHPIHLSPIDSIPRFAWGKFYADGERLLLPFSVQAHHALLDGLHMGRYYQSFQAYLDEPARFLD